MLKSLACAAFALSALPALAATPAAASAPATATGCSETNPYGGDMRVITCTLPAGQARTLTARFGGGHDDTAASLTATLDGQSTDCDAGSKMKLFGEDGDVSLHCRIAAATTPRTLVVTVLFTHAWYRDYLFAAP